VDGTYNMHGEDEKCIKSLVGRDKTTLRSRCRWEDNNKIHLKELGCESMDWIHLTESRIHW
jgi:hypothetical protein